MAEILLFHHAGGLTPGVTAFADRLRAAGHTVHTPDLFGGRTFADVNDGVAYAQELGNEARLKIASDAAEQLPADIVYGGMSMGCGAAGQLLFDRPGAAGAFFLYGAIDPSWWDTTWPAGVPAQAHQAEDDPWREIEAEEGFLARVPGGELFVYDGVGGHLFADDDSPEYDEQAAALATERILAFLAALG